MTGRLRVERPRLPVPARLDLRVDGCSAPWGQWVPAGPLARVEVLFAVALPAGGCLGRLGCSVEVPPGASAQLRLPGLPA